MVGSTRIWPFPISVTSLTPVSVYRTCLFLIFWCHSQTSPEIFICQNVVFSLVSTVFVVVSLAYPVNQYSYLLLICIEYVDNGLGAISCVDLLVDRLNDFLWVFTMADRSKFGYSVLSLEIYVSQGYPLGCLTYVFIVYPRGFLGKAHCGFLSVWVCWYVWVHLWVWMISVGLFP